ncbi:hypothetical protein [Planctomicrobium piriforme]|uniref:AsmA-like C-terminal region n=1 Tax=Planctomicrobium piriforme TaxID=1576369 RepID=A0A1I3LTM8_9PLAN|nr:hypothetical protein [Planctomicrobium piriforme]SFI88089.1 AsmA-like C-terminal region [Planctomicrobium piriforme]
MVKVKEQTTAADEKRKSRGIGSFFWGGLLVLGFLFFFLPTIAASVVESRDGVAWATGLPPGRLAIGQASFGWGAPVLLHNVLFNDKDGHTLAQVDSVTTQRSFWDFLVKPTDSLQLTLDGLKLTVVVKEPQPAEGNSAKTDVPQLVESVQSLALPKPERPMDIKITNGSIEFRNPQQEVIDVWTGLDAEYHFSGGTTPTQSFAGTIPASAERNTGELSAQGESHFSTDNPQQEIVTLNLTADRVPLLVAKPWLDKYLGPEQSLRSASGTVQANFHRDPAAGWQLTAASRLADPGAPASAVQLNIDSNYSKPNDQLQLPKIELTAQGTSLRLAGNISQLSGAQFVDVRGDIQTPGSPLLDLLPPELQREIQVTGMRFSEIALQGPLKPPAESPQSAFTFSALVGWDHAHAYGLDSQDGKLRLHYQNGKLVSEPMQLAVNGGQLRQLPMLDLAASPPVLYFREGLMLENVSLNEEVCRGWLKYVSPTLANATSADGRFSLTMKESQFVIGAPERGNVAGTLVLHEGRVRPGPLAAEMLQNVSQLEMLVQRINLPDLTQQTIMEIREEDVSFLLRDGRVYHDDFAVYIRNMRVATTGSVGLDQTLDLAVAMQIPDQWLQNAGPVLQALRGESIQLVVRGSLANPDVDARPVAEFGKRIGVKAAAGLLEQIIQRRQQRGK